MFITKKHLSRRAVLKGAGVTIGLPLLDAMIPAGTALANTAAVAPPRMGFVYFPHGAVQQNWQPTTTGRNFEFSPILKPLEPFREYVTVVTGLRNKAGESPAPHAIIAGTWLTCVHPPAGEQAPHVGPSADQVAARYIGQDTPLPSIELAGEGGGGACDPSFGCSYSGTIAFRTGEQPLPMEMDPRTAFIRMFGQGNTPAQRQEITLETGSILDYVREDAARLQRQLDPSDRRMVGDYLSSVREVERRIQKMEAKQATGAVQLPNAPEGVPDDFSKMLDTMFDMIALGWQSNTTRIATFMIAREVSMRTYPNLKITDAFHPLSHHQNDPVKLEKLTRIQNFHTLMFSRFVKRLKETPDGNGNLLDHSIILFGSNMANSDIHNNDPLPGAVIGLGNGRIKGGQHLHYPQDTPHANLLLTLLNRAGVDVKSHGISTGTLAEV
ncbi:MAG TPA: DUF1552 domain-containing protein [Steroidobacteraceae bacterium]|nr:DUF1552 domain-containing protein [Steroidobacteraceae bacterium]